jgi:hypothetical protein
MGVRRGSQMRSNPGRLTGVALDHAQGESNPTNDRNKNRYRSNGMKQTVQLARTNRSRDHLRGYSYSDPPRSASEREFVKESGQVRGSGVRSGFRVILV